METKELKDYKCSKCGYYIITARKIIKNDLYVCNSCIREVNKNIKSKTLNTRI